MEALTLIAIAAKCHWGYPATWIAQWKPALTTAEYVRRYPTFAAVVDGEPVGFAAVVPNLPDARLDHLWVHPVAMRRGVGCTLFRRAEEIARHAGARHLRIESDPHAQQFYEKMGATVYARRDATIDGVQRSLPLLVKTLAPLSP